MLFKVEKTQSASVLFDGSFRVKRVCIDPSIVDTFLNVGEGSTSTKAASGGIPDDDSGLGEDADVVEETQAEDFVSGLISNTGVAVQNATNFEDTAVVVEQVISIGSGPDLVDLGDGRRGGNTTVGVVEVDAGELVVVDNVKRNLADPFDEVAAVGRRLLPKAIKIEK